MKSIFKKALACLFALTIASCTTKNQAPSNDPSNPGPIQNYRVTEEQSDNIAINMLRYYFAENGLSSSEAIAVQGENEYAGIVYTDLESYVVDEEGKCYFEAGFFQIVPCLESTTNLLLPTEITEENPLIAVDADGMNFVITTSVVNFKSFSYIFDDWYIVVKRVGEMILEIKSLENKRDNYDYDISCYSYDKSQWIYKSDEEIKDFNVTATGLYSDYTKVYIQAVKMMQELVKIQDENSEWFESSICVVVSGELLRDTAFRNQQGTINGYLLTDLLSAQDQLKPNQSVYLSPNGLEIIEDTSDEQAKMRVEKGIIGIIANALLITGEVIIFVGTFGTTGLPMGIAIAAQITSICAIVYAIANVVESVSDVILGSQGDIETKAINYLKDEFAHIFGSKDAGDIAYNIWGIANSIISALVVPVGTVISGGIAIGESFGQITVAVLRLLGTRIAEAAVVAGVSTLRSFVAGEITYLITKNNVITAYVKDFTKIIFALAVGISIGLLDKQYDFTGLNKYETALALKARFGDDWQKEIYDKLRAAGNKVGPKVKKEALEDILNGGDPRKWGLRPGDEYDDAIIAFIKENHRFPSFNAGDDIQCEFGHGIDVQRLFDAVLKGKIGFEQALDAASNPLNGMLTSHHNHFFKLHGGDFRQYTDFNYVMSCRSDSISTIQSLAQILGLV